MTIIKMSRYRGDTIRLPVTIKTPAGVAVNLTGATIRFTLATITQATAGVVVSRTDADGAFTILIPYSVAGGLTAGQYFLDVEVTYADSTRDTLFMIELTLDGDKTV
jgi:hypothetical protein